MEPQKWDAVPLLLYWVLSQLLGTSLGGAPRTWKNEEQWGAPHSFPTSQWGGGRGLAEGTLSLYMDGHMSCLYPEPGWLMPGAQEQGAHTMGKEREREVVRETREHHALMTFKQGEGRCRNDSEAWHVHYLHLCC